MTQTLERSAPTPDAGMTVGRRLFLGSAVMLFAELALIRWLAANVVYLAYYTNFVLLASFLGIGIGFLRASRPKDRSGLAPTALAALLAFVALFPVQVAWSAERELEGLWGFPPLPDWLELPLLFIGVAAVFALIAEGVARNFARLEPLEAYRLDIAGSLTGIVTFALLSFAGTTPLLWFGLVALGSSACSSGRYLADGPGPRGRGRRGDGRDAVVERPLVAVLPRDDLRRGGRAGRDPRERASPPVDRADRAPAGRGRLLLRSLRPPRARTGRRPDRRRRQR